MIYEMPYRMQLPNHMLNNKLCNWNMLHTVVFIAGSNEELSVFVSLVLYINGC